MYFVKKTVLGFLVALLCGAAWCGVVANGHAGARRVNHLTRVSSHGRIAVMAEGNRFSESAKVSLSRTRADGVKRRIMEGLAKKRRGGPRLLGAAKEPSSRKEPSVLAMYDISIESDGAKWQPAAGEPVQVDVTLDEPVAITPGATLGVAHLADDGTVEALPASRYSFTYNAAKTAVTAFSFSAEGFSVYAITEGTDHTTDSDPARRIYQFYTLDESDSYVPFYFVADDNTRTFRQIVKDGQSLARPEMVSSMGRTFMGWYLFDGTDYAAAPFDFSKPITFDANETGEHVYTLRARFGDVGYVIFHDQSMTVGADKKWPITVVRRAPLTKNGNVLEATVEIDDVTVTYDESANDNSGEEEQENSAPKMLLRGWSRTPVDPGEPKDIYGNDVVRVESPLTFTRAEGDKGRPVDLYPIFVPIHWLSYQSAKTGEGASYCPPECLYEDEDKDELPQPNRTGYTFAGWYTEADGGVKVGNADGTLNTSANLSGWGGYIEDGKLKISEDVKLYGHWTPALTRYTVVIWQQKATDAANIANEDKTYDFRESIEYTERSEEEVSVSNDDKTRSYTGFHFGRCDDAAIVRGDGSTVLNVYYDRNVHTYRFYNTTSSSITATTSYVYSSPGVSYTYLDDTSYTLSRGNTDTYRNDTYQNNRKQIGGTNYYVSYRIRSSNNATRYAIYANNAWYQIGDNNNTAKLLYDNAPDITSFTYGSTISFSFGQQELTQTFAFGEEADSSVVDTLENADRKKTISGYEVSYTGSSSKTYYIKHSGTWYQIPASNGSSVYDNATGIEVVDDAVSQAFGVNSTAVSTSTTITTLEANKKGIGAYDVSYTGSGTSQTFYIKFNTDGKWHQITSNGSTLWDTATGITATTTSNQTEVLAITALYGASIKNFFPVKVNGTQHTWKATTTSIYQERLLIIEYMDDADILFYISDNNGRGGTIYMYVEVDEDESDGTQHGGKFYREYFHYEHNYNFLTAKEDFYALDGYSNDAKNADCNGQGATFSSSGRYPSSGSLPTGGNTVSKFYYDRLPFTIDFVDSYGNVTLDSVTMLYTQKLGPKVSELFPDGPESRREGYTFTGWYADSSCTTRVFFEEDEEYNNYTKNKVLYNRVPANNLQLFAGWETIWYLIRIDPNGGQLADSDSTWFWESYGGERVYEYNTASRSFMPSASGEWFYVVKNRDYYKSALAGEYGDQGDFDKFVADTWSDFEDDNGKTILGDRRAYYTTDVNDPGITDFTQYENRVNAYRYSGWYEVLMDDNGNEIGEALYKFGQKVTHDTTLRLHWKSLGTYELHYVAGDGTIDRLDDNEQYTFHEALDVAVFDDQSDLVVTRTATAPEGKYFVGWTVRNGDGTVYFPGQSFVLNAIYSEAGSAPNVRVVYLDAVYETIRTVSLTLDVNGSAQANASIGDDATSLTLAHPDPADEFASGSSDTTRTVSGLPNNAYGHLSDGTGYTCTIGDETLTFLGWNTRKDGTGTHFAPGAYVGVDALDTLDGSGANTLYAEWAVNVYFDKNNTQYTWEPGSADAWNANEFTYITDGANAGRYSQQTTLNGYARNPGVLQDIVDAETGKPMMFDFWSTKRYQDTADLEAYNFEETPVEGPLVLYAAWRDLIEVPLQVVDASEETIVDHSTLHSEDPDGWLKQLSIQVGNSTDVSFNDSPTQYVQLPDGSYQYAFTCIATSKDDISEGRKISRVYYNTSARSVYVEYADGTSEALPSEMKVFMVYFKNPRPINIGYREMGLDGFTTVTAKTDAPTQTDVGAEALNVADSLLTTPLQYPASGSYQHYAYALGDPNATAAAQLHYITETKTSNGSRPALQIRNTWRGFEYSSDNGTTWTHYGFDMQLYVVYFTAQPTIITLREETIGTAEDISAEFVYDVVISGGGSSESSTVTLRNGEAESLTLFASSSVQQSITITQRPKDGFTTTIGMTVDDPGVNGTANGLVYTATAAMSGGAETVTYTNSRGLLPLELNVAFGSGGEVTNVNGEYRTDAESGYTLNVPIQAGDPAPTPFSVTEQALTGRNKVYAEGTAADGLLSKEVGATHVFVGVWYGRPAQADGEAEEGDKVELEGRVTSVGFVKLAREDYYGICLNDDPDLPLGSYRLYYVYSEMPKIHYVKEGANGTLVKLETLAYQGVAYENVMPQDSMMSVGEAKALSVQFGGNGVNSEVVHVPFILDGSHPGSLDAVTIAAGPEKDGSVKESDLDGQTVMTSDPLKLQIRDGLVKWSLNGETWHDFSGSPAVYVIYREVGYNLTIKATTIANDADRAQAFTVSITSPALADGVSYEIDNYSVDSVTPTVGSETGTITLSLKDGDEVTIRALQSGSYSIVETLVDRFTLTHVKEGENYIDDSQLIKNADDALIGVNVVMEKNHSIELVNEKKYRVKFVDEDTTTVLKDEVTYAFQTTADKVAKPEDEPTKPMNDEYTFLYRFEGWSEDGETVTAVADVTKDVVYRAKYREIEVPKLRQRAVALDLVIRLAEPEETDAAERKRKYEAKLIGALAAADVTLKDTGFFHESDTAYDYLNEMQPNGLRLWECLRTGTPVTQKLLDTALGEGANQLSLTMAAAPVDIKDLGYDVYHVLRKYKENGESVTWDDVSARVMGTYPNFEKPAFAIDLLDEEGKSKNASGFYRVVTQIVPKYNTEKIINEIPSPNIIAVLEVNSGLKKTMTAIPWVALPSDPDAAALPSITVNNYVQTGQLSAGDAVYSIDANGIYEQWVLGSGDGQQGALTWTSATTVANGSSGETVVQDASDPATHGLSRGAATWVERTSDGKPYFLVGQYAPGNITVNIAGGSDTVPASTIIANPSINALPVNSIAWGDNPTTKDTIEVYNDKNICYNLQWNMKKKEWGRSAKVWDDTFKAYRSQWQNDFTIPAGTGVRYKRCGGAFTVTVSADQVKESVQSGTGE